MSKALQNAGWTLLGLGWLWALLALALHPAWPAVGRGSAVAGWLAASAGLLRRTRGRWAVGGLVAGILGVGMLWTFIVPATQRDWSPDVARQATATFAGDSVTIHNVRHATYRTTADYDVTWEDRRYDLRQLQTVDFMVEPFSTWRGLAHTLVSFGFADGEHVAISVETRRERGETYSPLRGMFRHYELIYVIGDERDLIGLRANIRRDAVYLYPIRTTPAAARALFVAMLTRANRLATMPEFYHSLLNTCTSNIRRHVADLRADGLRPGWRTVFPGYADALAWELGLLDSDGSLPAARARFHINDRSAFTPTTDGKAWSRQIRRPPQ